MHRSPEPELMCDPPHCFVDAPTRGCQCRIAASGPFDLQVAAQIRARALGLGDEGAAFAVRFLSELRRFLGRRELDSWLRGDLERYMTFCAPGLTADERVLAGELLALVERTLTLMRRHRGQQPLQFVISSDSDSARLHPSLADTQLLPYESDDDDFLAETLARLERLGL